MATSGPRRKAFIYKNAVFSKPVGKGVTLETLLKAAFKANPLPWKRQHNPSGDGVSFSFINYTGTHGRKGGTIGNLLGGEFFSYTRGADQSTLEIDPNATELNISSLAPGLKKEFLEGAVYFGVIDNHLIAMQSSALRILDLERHLNWLLTANIRPPVRDDKPLGGQCRRCARRSSTACQRERFSFGSNGFGKLRGLV